MDAPFDDDDLERFRALLEQSRESIAEGKGLSEDAFWKAVRKRSRERKPATPKARRTKD